MSKLGENIKKFRKIKKLSREYLSNKLGISIHTLSKYEQGQREPNIDMINKIANALEVTINELAGEKDTITSKVLKQLISEDSSLEQISNDTNISIDRLKSFLSNTNNATYEEIKEIAQCIDCNDEQIAQWIAADTFTTVVYNNKDNDPQGNLIKKYFLNEPITKEDFINGLLDEDKEIVNEFYPYLNNKNSKDYMPIPGGVFKKPDINNPGAFYEAVATLCYIVDRDFANLNLSDTEYHELGKKIRDMIEFELFKINKNKYSNTNGQKDD